MQKKERQAKFLELLAEGFTQREIAKQIGVSEQRLSVWKRELKINEKSEQRLSEARENLQASRGELSEGLTRLYRRISKELEKRDLVFIKEVDLISALAKIADAFAKLNGLYDTQPGTGERLNVIISERFRPGYKEETEV